VIWRLALCALLALACSKPNAVSDGGVAGADDACSLADEPRFDGAPGITWDGAVEPNFFGAWSVDPYSIYAVGTGGLIVHWNGTDWRPETTPPPPDPARADLLGISGTYYDDIYAVGQAGAIYYYDGISWALRSGPPGDGGVFDVDLHAVAANQRGEAWAVGLNGTVIHTVDFGATWTRESVPTLETLNGIFIGGTWGFAVGNLGTILAYDAGGWQRYRVGSIMAHLKGVYAFGQGQAYAAGLNGMLLSNRSGEWQEVTPTALQPRDRECAQTSAPWPSVYLRDMTGINGRLLIVGWSGTVMFLADDSATVYQVTENRLESAFTFQVPDELPPGTEIPDGGPPMHDEAVIVGVTGALIRVR
jgi:hypothetical protein